MQPRALPHALTWLRAGDLAADPTLTPDQNAEHNARRVRACFLDYPDVLQLILDMSLFRSPVDHRLAGEAYLRHAQAREGQNQLAAAILHYIDQAETLDRRPSNATDQPDDGRRDDLLFADGASSGPGIALG